MRRLGASLAVVALAGLIIASQAGAAPKRIPLTDGPPKDIAGLETDSAGRAVVALSAARGTRPWVLRLSSDGSPDPSFGTGGVLRPSVEGNSVQVEVRRDGSVLIAGVRGYETVLRLFRPDGSLDPSFGKHGSIHIHRVEIERVMQQRSGGIVVLGVSTCSPSECGYLYRNLQVIRLSGKGKVLRRLNISHEAWGLDSAGMGPTGNVVVSGLDWELEHPSWDAFLANGKVDKRFSERKLTSDAEEVPVASDIAFQADGRFVMATEVGLWRRNHDGSPDSTFGEGGRVVCGPIPDPKSVDYAPFAFVRATANGKLTAAGGEGDCGLVRYLTDGSLDPSFAGDGKIDLGAEGVDQPVALALSRESPVLASWDKVTTSLQLARFTPEGSLDDAFGSGGRVVLAPWLSG